MWFYLVDPVLRAPTIGSMLMCLAAALVGVLVFLRKQSLLGETLSHATYPGVIAGVLVVAPFLTMSNEGPLIAVAVMAGATVSATLGMITINWLETTFRIRPDSALCFVLSGFFGVGLTVASRIQFTHTTLYLKMQAYLYGQPATMTDVHILIYAILAFVVIAVIIFLYKELQVLVFDREYARSLGINTRAVDTLIIALVVVAVVVGIRSVGVVLMSAMLIAPAAAARQMTERVSKMLWFAGAIGLASGFFGNYLSIEIPRWVEACDPECSLLLPTGPMIVLVSSMLCVAALLFAPKRGLFPRVVRAARFRYRCLCENTLKSIWRAGQDGDVVTLKELQQWQEISKWYLCWVLWRLDSAGWVKAGEKGYRLTRDGKRAAMRIIRLHRLWELYLTEYVGVDVERVHCSAEEMEHIITPEIEEQLTLLLDDPRCDPHHQPIPPKNTIGEDIR